MIAGERVRPGYWFRPKRFGYGAVPATWQGWAATLGVNWYLNSFTRFQVNAIHWSAENTAGSFTGKDDGETLSARVGVTF